MVLLRPYWLKNAILATMRLFFFESGLQDWPDFRIYGNSRFHTFLFSTCDTYLQYFLIVEDLQFNWLGHSTEFCKIHISCRYLKTQNTKPQKVVSISSKPSTNLPRCGLKMCSFFFLWKSYTSFLIKVS